MRNFIQAVLAFAVITISSSLLAQTIVIDNADASFEGTWQTATSSNDRYDKDYKFSSTTESSTTASATYTPDIKTAGKYSIDIWYPRGDNRATNAPWVITYDGGKETVTVNQRINGGQWVRIAKDKPFRTGNSGSAQVINNSGASGSVVVADAVRFVPEGAKDSPQASISPSETKPNTSTSRPGTPAVGRNNFVLTVTAVNGSVMRVPDDISYALGTEVKLVPRPDIGFIFNGWTGDTGVAGKTFRNPLVIKMDANKIIVCDFAAAGIGVIIDNDDPEMKTEGSWVVSSGEWLGKKYKTYHVTTAKAKADAKATYSPNLPRAGKYDVYVWYPAGKNRTSAAPWTISSKSGVTTNLINQQQSNGTWVALATGVEMEAGSKPNQFVQVTNNTSDHDQPSQDGRKVVIADAVAFVYVGE